MKTIKNKYKDIKHIINISKQIKKNSELGKKKDFFK